MQVIVIWTVAALMFVGLDAVWLSRMGPTFYRSVLGDQMRSTLDFAPTLAFYVIYISALCYFAVLPALERGELMRAVVNGALLGLVAYATYDLTNQATLKFWSWRLTFVDIAWGAFASAIASGAAFLVGRLILR